MLLEAKRFYWKSDKEQKRLDYGFIAQDVDKLFPEIAFTNPVDGYMGVNYDRFIPVLTKALQEQQQIIEQQQKVIEQLQVKNNQINSSNQSLEDRIKMLEQSVYQKASK